MCRVFREERISEIYKREYKNEDRSQKILGLFFEDIK